MFPLIVSATIALSTGCGSLHSSLGSTNQASGGDGTTNSGTSNSGNSGTGSSGSGNSGSGSSGSGSSGSGSTGSGSGSSGSGNTGSGSSGSGGSNSGSGSGNSGSSGNNGGQGDGNLPADVPADAVAVTDIQTMKNWIAVYDTATSGSKGSSTGTTDLVPTPSTSGTSREFYTTYSGAGGERYHVSFGNDTQATNFFYDAQVYIPQVTKDLANLEFDMNQVMPNGQTVIFGFQCDGYSGTWDYTENEGTPQKPKNHWLHSSAKCNVQNWTSATWHHVQVSYSRDDEGNVTYKSVWLDGAEQIINDTVNSASVLHWAPDLLTNFQVDGRGASGSTTVYLDQLTVYRW